MNKKTKSVAPQYLLLVFIIAYALQIVAIYFGGTFSQGTENLNSFQSSLLVICMFVPAAVLLLFCLLKKISIKEVGLRPLKPLTWVAAFGIIALVEVITLLALRWCSTFPNLVITEGKWRLLGVASIFGFPNPPLFFVINLLLSMALAAIFTIPQALGEELGWRGYLQPVFIKKFGAVKGIVILGVIWGLFHVPINLAGYNFTETPILGAFVFMPISCISLSAIFGWFRLKTGSVWPAAVAHASFNILDVIIVMCVPSISPLLYNIYICAVQLLIGGFFLWRISKYSQAKVPATVS